jgi:serine/threonine-protein kinase
VSTVPDPVLSDTVLAHLRGAAADAAAFAHPRYEIIESIGAGGMARVYRARDRELGREVALKVLHDPPPDPAAGERTLREARIIARLEHPGIVPVHDAGQTPDGRIFYVMKLVRGRRLDERFAAPAGAEDGAGAAREALAERLRVFERICETIAFAHAHGVLHRDLKPQNVMVGAFGEVLVLDWGLARERAVATAGESAGVVLGTPAYMPPEQARGANELVDERSDVFALGAMLYFLLTGRAPVGRTLFERQQRDEAVTFESPRRANPRVPRPLAAICLKALAPLPAARYASAAALATDISRFRAGDRVAAYREGAAARTARLAWKYRVPIALISAYLLIRWVLIAAF